jgi:hypothetical protein
MNWDAFTFEIAGKVQAVPVLELFLITFADKRSSGESLAAFYRTVVDAHGKRWRFHQLNDSKRAKKTQAKDLEMLPFWMSDESSLREAWLGINFHSGSVSDEQMPPAFEYFHDEQSDETLAGVVRIAVPVAPLDEAKRAVLQFADAAADAGFPLAWGFAGYSLLWNSLGEHRSETARWMAPHLVRHPGLSLGMLPFYLNLARLGVGHIGWLTLLGPDYVTKLGGLAALEAAAKKASVSVQRYGSAGAIVRAGEDPQLGDVNRNDPLAAQQAIGRMLDPVRVPDDTISEVVWVDGMKAEAAQAWFRRFFAQESD